MADIQMEYRQFYCDVINAVVCGDCFIGGRKGCCYYSNKKPNDNRYAFSDWCIHIRCSTKYKGISTKNYEIEEVLDDYEVGDYMLVTIKGKRYECDKVILDGVQIYPEPEQEVTQ